MNRKGFYVWIASLVVFALSVIPFVFFMFNLYVRNLILAIPLIVIGAILYVIGTRMMTHKKGYNLFNASQFYKMCAEKGFDSTKECKRNADEFRELAEQNDFSKNLSLSELCEMYSIGYDFCNKKKG